MKAKHRHELKTNELAEWIANFPVWAKKNAKNIIYVSAALALVIVAYAYHNYTKNVAIPEKQIEFTRTIATLPRRKTEILKAQAQGLDYSIILLQTADEFQISSVTAKNDFTVALALIKQAQALRMELHYRMQSASDDEITAQINKARTIYNDAVEKAKGNISLTAMAKLGIGLCDEELGNFQNAEEIYKEIVNDTSLDATTAKAHAQIRLKIMSDYQKKVVFKKPPEPSVELLQPDIELDSLDINLPSITQ